MDFDVNPKTGEMVIYSWNDDRTSSVDIVTSDGRRVGEIPSTCTPQWPRWSSGGKYLYFFCINGPPYRKGRNDTEPQSFSTTRHVPLDSKLGRRMAPK